MEFFLIPTLRSALNVHYIPPGGNYFNVNAGIMPMQNVVFAIKFHQGLSDKIVKYTHSQINVFASRIWKGSRLS